METAEAARGLVSLSHPMGLGSVGMVVHCSVCCQGDKPVFLLCEVPVEWGPWGFS